MSASISTIGPPYGTEAPPPRSIPAEGLIHASRQRFTTSLLALGSTVLIWSGPATKGRLYVKDYFPKGFALDCLRSWVLWAGDVCARPRFALGQYLQLEGEYICHHPLSLTQKCERILIETTSETPQGRWSSVQSSVKAQCFCGALEERSALRWTFCCLPKCFSVFH